MIDFFKPVESAWARMENCLFKPFDIGKWFVLGFTAWLASFLAAGGSNFNFGGPGGGGSEKPGVSHDAFKDLGHDLIGWGLPVWLGLLTLLVVLILVIGLVILWLGCRGQFMFLDNVLHNRAEVQKPWKEFERHGTSLFWVYGGIITAMVLVSFLFFAGGLAYFWSDLVVQKSRGFAVYVPWIVGFLLLMLVWIGVSIGLFFLREFGVPMMYRSGCSGTEALQRVWGLVSARPLDSLVYLFIRAVMGILFAMLACLAGCFTCCLGFLPYLSAVVTLPIMVFRVSYTLDCLFQLTGEDYWPVVTPPLPPPPFIPPVVG